MLRSKVEEGQVAMDTLTVEKQELASRLSAVENQKQTLDKQNQVSHNMCTYSRLLKENNN